MKQSNHVYWTLLGIMALAGTCLPAQAAFISISTCNPAVDAPAGSLISQSGDYAVTADLSQPGAADCILITASNVSLKLNGHRISGTTGATNGINVNPPSGRVDHVGISGPGFINGFTNGVRVVNADYAQVSSLSASANFTNGVTGNGANFLTVAGNILGGNGVWGLLLINVNSSTVQYNDMSGNGLVNNGFNPPTVAGGMRLASGSANTINNNIANGNGAQTNPLPTFNGGILIGANGNRLFSNTTNGNFGPGIEVSGSSNQLFHNTSVTGFALALDLKDDNTNCDSNTWADNTFYTASPSTCIH